MIDKIRYTMQRVLPIVFDDSLSFMELLSKVIDTTNQVITQVNSSVDEISDYKEAIDAAIAEFESGVNTEINNFESGVNTSLTEFQNTLDRYISMIEDETDEVLEGWLEDGTLLTLIATLSHATSSDFGTVKLSDSYTADGTAANGLAPSQKALSEGLAIKFNIEGTSVISAEFGLDGNTPYILTEANPSYGAYDPTTKYCKIYFNPYGGILRGYSADGETWDFSAEHATGMSFGIVKLSDSYTDNGGAYGGLAPSQHALYEGLATKVNKSTFFGMAVTNASVYSMASTGTGSMLLGTASSGSFFAISEEKTVNNVKWYKVYSFGAETVGFVQASAVNLISDEVEPAP